MYGLPGSGKSYFCSKNCTKQDIYIDLDGYYKEHVFSCARKTFAEWAEDCICIKLRYTHENTFIDGLISTHEELAYVIRATIDTIRSYGETDMPLFVIHAWNEDRDACFWNDVGRRRENSIFTITHRKYEPLCIEDVWKAVGNDYVAKAEFNICKHVVTRKPAYKEWFGKCGINMSEDYDKYTQKFKKVDRLYSDSWSKGGEICSYDGASCSVDADNPCEFTQLYDLLLSIDENIPFRIVRKILDEIVHIEECKYGDYYGGQQTDARYYVSLEELYEYLEEYHKTE